MNKTVILKCPKHIKPFRNNTKTICIDVEIQKVIKQLWKNKIITLGCCQGENAKNPDIVVWEEYTKEDIKRIKKLIAEVDNRKWTIYGESKTTPQICMTYSQYT